jgi:hypothetical protein
MAAIAASTVMSEALPQLWQDAPNQRLEARGR